jgi:hypothetical protein
LGYLSELISEVQEPNPFDDIFPENERHKVLKETHSRARLYASIATIFETARLIYSITGQYGNEIVLQV